MKDKKARVPSPPSPGCGVLPLLVQHAPQRPIPPLPLESIRRALEPPAHPLPDSAPSLPNLLPLKMWWCDSTYLSASLSGPL